MSSGTETTEEAAVEGKKGTEAVTRSAAVRGWTGTEAEADDVSNVTEGDASVWSSCEPYACCW